MKIKKENLQSKLFHGINPPCGFFRVIIKDPGKKPRCVNISNTLENLQKTVGGYIETVTIASDMVIICNEEGRLLDLPYNCNVCGIDYVGTIIFCGMSEDEFCDLPVEYKELKWMLPGLWEDGGGAE